MHVVDSMLAALFHILLGAAAVWIWQKARMLHRYGYVRKLFAEQRRVQIVVPSVYVPEFSFDDHGQKLTQVNPSNLLFMPMQEGLAIGNLVRLLHRALPSLEIQLVTEEHYDSEVPLLSIGGPSVNCLSAKILESSFPAFSIAYPEAKWARFDTQMFQTVWDGDVLKKDFGFVFLTKTKGVPCMVFCGVLAFGTAMAVELFASLLPGSDAAKLMRHGGTVLLVGAGNVSGITETGDVDICLARALN